jgi:hypothetical protein
MILLFTLVNPDNFKVTLRETGEDVGDLMRDDDPYFYWYPPSPAMGIGFTCIVLSEIVEKLKELNESNQ